jgi:protocatechuate 3,4-dioxygenase beta subunit
MGGRRFTRFPARLASVVAFVLATTLSSTDTIAGGKPAKPPPAKPPPAKPAPAAAAFGSVEGTAVDEAGKPVEGAQVLLVREKPASTWKATTDAQGKFSLKGISPGPLAATVRARGRIPFNGTFEVVAGRATTVDSKLEPGVRFAGKVTDTNGKPVSGAKVMAYRSGREDEDNPFAFSFLGFGGSGKSGPDGSFEVDGLAPGQSYKLRVSHPHHLAVDLPGLPAVAGGGHDALDVSLEDAAWVTGVVVDSAGKPIAGAHVVGPDRGAESTVSSLGGLLITILMSDGDPEDATLPDGKFEVGGIREEEATLETSAEGYFDATTRLEGLVAGKPRADVKIALEPATATIEGVVVGPDGKGVAGLGVSADGDVGTAAFAETDAQGRFKMTRVKSHQPVELSAGGGDWVWTRVEKVALNSKDAKIALARSPRLKVKVLGEDGKPLAHVRLVIRTTDADGDHDESTQDLDQPDAGIDVALRVGQATIEASAEGYDPESLGPYTLAAGAVEAAEPVTLKRSR